MLSLRDYVYVTLSIIVILLHIFNNTVINNVSVSYLVIFLSLYVRHVGDLVTEIGRAQLLHAIRVLHLQSHSPFQILPDVIEEF